MRLADLDATTVWFTASNVPMARNCPALVVELENAWELANTDPWSHKPISLRAWEATAPGSSRRQRMIPIVVWDGVTPDVETVTEKLRQAVEVARPLMVAGNEVNDVDRAVREAVGDYELGTGGRGYVAFRMVRPQAIDRTWESHRIAEERSRASFREREAREAAESARQADARGRVVPVLTAAGLTMRSTGGDSVTLSWTQLERAIEAARAGVTA